MLIVECRLTSAIVPSRARPVRAEMKGAREHWMEKWVKRGLKMFCHGPIRMTSPEQRVKVVENGFRQEGWSQAEVGLTGQGGQLRIDLSVWNYFRTMKRHPNHINKLKIKWMSFNRRNALIWRRGSSPFAFALWSWANGFWWDAVHFCWETINS